MACAQAAQSLCVFPGVSGGPFNGAACPRCGASCVCSVGPCMQAQRAGNIPNDSMALFPNVWEWKRPGYVNACSDFMASLSPEDRAGVDFPNNAGFFEAGSESSFSPLQMHATHEYTVLVVAVL